jgi:hypothetical protein
MARRRTAFVVAVGSRRDHDMVVVIKFEKEEGGRLGHRDEDGKRLMIAVDHKCRGEEGGGGSAVQEGADGAEHEHEGELGADRRLVRGRCGGALGEVRVSL